MNYLLTISGQLFTHYSGLAEGGRGAEVVIMGGEARIMGDRGTQNAGGVAAEAGQSETEQIVGVLVDVQQKGVAVEAGGRTDTGEMSLGLSTLIGSMESVGGEERRIELRVTRRRTGRPLRGVALRGGSKMMMKLKGGRQVEGSLSRIRRTRRTPSTGSE